MRKVYRCVKGCWSDDKPPACNHGGVSVHTVASVATFPAKGVSTMTFEDYIAGRPFSKGKTGCPCMDQYGLACPNDSNGYDCPAKQSLIAACPFQQEADPDERHGWDTLTPSSTDTSEEGGRHMHFTPLQIKRAAQRAADLALTEVIRDAVRSAIPTTNADCHRGMVARGDSRKEQDQIAKELEEERGEYVQALSGDGSPVASAVRFEHRSELSGYLKDTRWPVGMPIHTLGID